MNNPFKPTINKDLEEFFLEHAKSKETGRTVFIKKQKRSMILPMLKSFKKSQDSKRAWSRGRFGIMQAIRKFHGSIEGAKLHRKMSRYLILRQPTEKMSLLKEDKEFLADWVIEVLNTTNMYPGIRADMELLLEELQLTF